MGPTVPFWAVAVVLAGMGHVVPVLFVAFVAF